MIAPLKVCLMWKGALISWRLAPLTINNQTIRDFETAADPQRETVTRRAEKLFGKKEEMF